MHPKHLSIGDFVYSLPAERIANYPLENRDASRLLVYKKGKLDEDIYRNIHHHIPPGSLLVFNDTKVVAARLLFKKPTGGIIEIFCLEPSEQYPDIIAAMQQHESVYWKCLIGGASKWKAGQVLEMNLTKGEKKIKLAATYIEKSGDSFIIKLAWSPPQLTFSEVLHIAGAIPLPPYIKRPAEESDKTRYQTIYAQYEGSVAAPTAGLHFTEHIFEKLREKKIDTCRLTLHVSAGTFKPVKSVTMEAHEMHAEFIDVSIPTIENIISHLQENIIAVGTTSLRTLETLYWLGVKTIHFSKMSPLELNQWEAYEMKEQEISAGKALQSLCEWMKKNKMERMVARTSILIAPGYKTRIAKALVTNFHQPESTLLLLVAALVGDDWKKIYDYALQNNFRFLSYGDGSLLWVAS